MAATIDKVGKLARRGVSRSKLREGEAMKVRVRGARKKWTEKELLEGVTPASCDPDLIPDRVGRERL